MSTLSDFQVPAISNEKISDSKGIFTIEPLDKGFGYTYGNGLRRVLLSSLGGAAITNVRIEGVHHEFSTIDGVREDVTDIILNLKDIVARLHTEADEVEVSLVSNKPGDLTAGDIDLPAGVEILNPEAPIASLEKGANLELYLTISRGRGYQPAEDTIDEDRPVGSIPIDAIFSPIRRASYSVDSSRVGQHTDFDKLTLEVETDGSIEPAAALREASELLIKTLAIFTDADRVAELTDREAASEPAATAPAAAAAVDGGDERKIEELELGVRAYNCLKRAGIETIGELVGRSEQELGAIQNFGQRSIAEVSEALGELGLRLRED